MAVLEDHEAVFDAKFAASPMLPKLLKTLDVYDAVLDAHTATLDACTLMLLAKVAMPRGA
jgi:hypothetical protein